MARARRSPGSQAAAGARSGPSLRRCAIYTRKSSEDGLEQAFNSLHAQREACEAYILSQRHEGWQALPALYDDGGLSGGTLERPALQRLLGDIQAGKIDLVVVYKVDRLTRALSDFAKIVDVFDGHGVSFVSVTQQFNTTTSMGRLTLNMLLSFAQFEREVTGERIRDKVAASKRKGMWMGGTVPLGYDVQDRALVVNEAEAVIVRHIYERYLTLATVHDLQQALAAEGIRGKQRKTQEAPILVRGALYTLLQNRLYRGEITHKGAVYPGAHAAIIEPALWDAVQQRLQANRLAHRRQTRAQHPSLLAGLVVDSKAQRLTPSHASKGSTRYRYYVSEALITGRRKAAAEGLRVPAGDLETLVVRQLEQLLGDERRLLEALRSRQVAEDKIAALLQAGRSTAQQLSTQSQAELRPLLQQLIRQVVVTADGLRLDLRLSHLGPHDPDERIFSLQIAAQLCRAGMETRLLIAGEQAAEPDATLIRLLTRAHSVWARMKSSSMAEAAAAEGLTSSYVTRLVRLVFLAPDIVAAILDGRQPPALSANRLMQDTKLPLAWVEQRQRLGLPAPPA